MSEPKLETLAERVWFAWHCLPRDAAGRPPSWRSLEMGFELPNALFSNLLSGRRRDVETKTAANLTAALGVKIEWLLQGTGQGPVPVDDVPPMPTGKPAPHRRSVGAYLRRFDFEPARVEAALAALFDVTPP